MRRQFNRETLAAHATDAIRASVGIGAMVWRFTVLVPLEEVSPGAGSRQIATDDEIDNLEEMLTAHFRGLTIAPMLTGYGLRAGLMEVNTHHPIIVYAAAIAASERYFAALRMELQDAFDQELILVERQEVWLQ